MQNEDFEQALYRFLRVRTELFATIPADFPLWSITPVTVQEWLPTFVSARAGRWNVDGVPAKYFADSLATCLAEMVGCDEEIEDCVCEHWKTTASLRVLDVGKFPPSLQACLFEAGGLPVEKWAKSHLCLRVLKMFPEYRTATAIKAPSAYGMALGLPGYTIAANPLEHPLEFVDKTILDARVCQS